MRRFLVVTTVTLLIIGNFAAATPDTAAGAAQAAAPSTAELDKLLAPIALYPDQLLAQMLMCAAKPSNVAALSEWLASHQSQKGTELQDAATKAGFEPEFVAMALFPDVINSMASRIDWTTQLGSAFASHRSAVFDSIQRLRAQAQKAGKLKDSAQQDIETKKTSSGQEVIVIEPTNPQVVYVPQYNPTTVYTQPTSSTVVVQESSSSGDAVAAGLIGFTAGIAIGAAMDNDYYYSPYGWGYRGAYMYNDAWDDYYDHREDAREDYMDHREDIMEDRSERAEDARENRSERSQNAQEQRTERQGNRQENRPEATQAQKDQARSKAQERQASGQSASGQAASTARSSAASRGSSTTGTTRTAPERSGTRSDAFSGYSSGKSTSAASQRGQRSRSSSSRSGGGGSRRR
jgi:Protein of unknown function (DUF3300)